MKYGRGPTCFHAGTNGSFVSAFFVRRVTVLLAAVLVGAAASVAFRGIAAPFRSSQVYPARSIRSRGVLLRRRFLCAALVARRRDRLADLRLGLQRHLPEEPREREREQRDDSRG